MLQIQLQRDIKIPLVEVMFVWCLPQLRGCPWKIDLSVQRNLSGSQVFGAEIRHQHWMGLTWTLSTEHQHSPSSALLHNSQPKGSLWRTGTILIYQHIPQWAEQTEIPGWALPMQRFWAVYGNEPPRFAFDLSFVWHRNFKIAESRISKNSAASLSSATLL